MIKSILQGRFMGHPLHPMLVHLPVALWPLSLVSDIVFMATADPFFATASFYLIGVGVVGALIASLAGSADLMGVPRRTLAMRIGLTHAVLNVLVVALYAVSFFGRGNLSTGSNGAVNSTSLILNIISVALLSVSGYLGGTLVYAHGVGLRTDQRNDELDGKLRRVA